MPCLIVTARFNPPSIRLMGTTLREETIHRLDTKLYNTTTTSHSPKQEPPKFEYVQNPPHWVLDMPKMYCDQVARSSLLLSIIEILEAEDWKLKASHSVVHASHQWKSTDAGMDTQRLIFTRT